VDVSSSPSGKSSGAAAAICALAFVVVLAVAAWFDASIRLLHCFEAVPYILAAALCWRLSKHGFALGIAAGGLWFWMGVFGTRFAFNGFQQLGQWLQSGRLERPDLVLAVPAAASTLGLALFSTVGYVRLAQRKLADLGLVVLYAFLILAFFIGIFALFAPRYLGVFGIHVGT
jgi:hypothetical protein